MTSLPDLYLYSGMSRPMGGGGLNLASLRFTGPSLRRPFLCSETVIVTCGPHVQTVTLLPYYETELLENCELYYMNYIHDLINFKSSTVNNISAFG